MKNDCFFWVMGKQNSYNQNAKINMVVHDDNKTKNIIKSLASQ